MRCHKYVGEQRCSLDAGHSRTSCMPWSDPTPDAAPRCDEVLAGIAQCALAAGHDGQHSDGGVWAEGRWGDAAPVPVDSGCHHCNGPLSAKAGVGQYECPACIERYPAVPVDSPPADVQRVAREVYEVIMSYDDEIEEIGEEHRDVGAIAAALQSEREAAEKRALQPVRRALSSAGYCGDGGVAQMVTRALGEAEKKGRDANDVYAALAAAESALDPDALGTLAERIAATAEAAEARGRDAERLRCAEWAADYSSGAYMDAAVENLPQCCARERKGFWEEMQSLVRVIMEGKPSESEAEDA